MLAIPRAARRIMPARNPVRRRAVQRISWLQQPTQATHAHLPLLLTRSSMLQHPAKYRHSFM